MVSSIHPLLPLLRPPFPSSSSLSPHYYHRNNTVRGHLIPPSKSTHLPMFHARSQHRSPRCLSNKTTPTSSSLRQSLLQNIGLRIRTSPAGINTFTCRAASIDSVSDPDNSGANNSNNKTTLHLAIVFGFWYFQNVVFNIYNKMVLNVFPYPWLLASFQLLAGSLWMSALWLSRLKPFPCPLTGRFFLALLGPAFFHTVGHISACVSFSKVAVSFTHVIKASEPVFSVLFSALLRVRLYPLPVWLSVLPIVAGCSLAAVTEVSFNAQGLWGALISNVGFVLRNIYSKKSLQDFAHVDGLNLYGWISILSLLYLFPVAIFVEGSQWAEGFRRALGAVPTPWTFYFWVLLSGIFYHLYNQSSYQALDEISPLTFSVGNTMKRVVVIVASVLVFRNPIRPLNALGSAIAIFGTYLYSQATAMGNTNEKDVPDKKS